MFHYVLLILRFAGERVFTTTAGVRRAYSDPVGGDNGERRVRRDGSGNVYCVHNTNARYKDATLRKRRTDEDDDGARRPQTHNPELLKTQ